MSRLVKDTCPKCGYTDIPPDSKFCNECGAPLDETAPRGDTKTASTRTKHEGEAIDLWLPSGTKWACCNVGATKPEEFGGYYAWGETEEKTTYDKNKYKYYNNGSFVSLGSDISGTKYDVAHVQWGDNWVMPTNDQIIELTKNCTSTWTTVNGVNGRLFTSKTNDGYIFLPAAGYMSGSDRKDANSCGHYWESAQDPSVSSHAFCLYFRSGSIYTNGYTRSLGLSVRPVSR